MFRNPNLADFYINELKPLVGGTIQGFLKDDLYGYYALVIETPEGKTLQLWIYSDDEGNNPGSFEIVEDK